jgi:arylformamidase
MVNSFYDHAYNTRVGVDNVPEIFEQWERTSAIVRRALPSKLDLRYGQGRRETIDLFFAEDSSQWLVFIHGGYWRTMTKEYFSFVAPPFVQAGWNVALIEYDLCPAVTIHTIVDQCRRALSWLGKHSRDYEAECEHVIISGHSAGGHLTAMMFTTDWATYRFDPEIIAGGIAISGLFDLDPIAQTAMNADLKLSPDDVHTLSPVRLTPRVQSPLVLAVGEKESGEFHRQSNLLHGSKGWNRITSLPISIEKAHHFNVLDDFMNLDGAVWYALRTMSGTG